MANFVMEFPHTQQMCMQELDDLAAKNPDLLSKINWGCMGGNHTGWTTVEVGNEEEARNMLPPELRDNVRIAEVNKFTPDQIRSMHEMAA